MHFKQVDSWSYARNYSSAHVLRQAPNGRISVKYVIWFSSKIYREKSSSLQSCKNNKCFTGRAMQIYDKILLNSSLNETCFGQRCKKS